MTDTIQTQVDMAHSNAISRVGDLHVRNAEDHMAALIEQHIAQVGRPDPRVMARMLIAAHTSYMAPAMAEQRKMAAQDAAAKASDAAKQDANAEIAAARAETAEVHAKLDAKSEELEALKTTLREAGEHHG